jgi:hypothetical protein
MNRAHVALRRHGEERRRDLRCDDGLRDQGLEQSMLAPEVRRGDDAHEYGTEGMGRRGDGDEGMGKSVGCVTCGAGADYRSE